MKNCISSHKTSHVLHPQPLKLKLDKVTSIQWKLAKHKNKNQPNKTSLHHFGCFSILLIEMCVCVCVHAHGRYLNEPVLHLPSENSSCVLDKVESWLKMWNTLLAWHPGKATSALSTITTGDIKMNMVFKTPCKDLCTYCSINYKRPPMSKQPKL